MKIGILSLNFSWHGEATAAATWATHLNENGYDAELFTFSRSGKKIKRMRTDYEFTCLKSRDTDTCLKFLDSKDIIVSFGTGVAGEKEDEDPHYYLPLENMITPLIAYIPIQDQHLMKTYKHSERFLSLPTIVGTLFLRESIRSKCYSGEYSHLFNSLPSHVVKHPVSMDGVEPIFCEDNVFVCTTRIAPSKKIKQILTAIRDYDLLSTADISFWGDKGESRYGFLLEQEFGDSFLDIYKGPYNHSQLDDIYKGARFCFDMTNFVGDGGVQNTYLEAMKRSVLPIVPEQWNVWDSCLTVPEPTPENIGEAVVEALGMDEATRISMVKRGHAYIREHHDPRLQTAGLVGYLKGLL